MQAFTHSTSTTIHNDYGTFLVAASTLLSMGVAALAVIFVEKTERECERAKEVEHIGTGVIYLVILSLFATFYMVFYHLE
jgi:putative exporter of polyketide antibiotics